MGDDSTKDDPFSEHELRTLISMGGDVHKRVAEILYASDSNTTPKERRQRASSIMFRLVYGGEVKV